MKKISQAGQISLLVLIVAAVVTTLGLSVSQKSVLETKIDTDEEALKQAFSSAESGIEYYLGSGKTPINGKVTYTSPDGKSRAQVEATRLGTESEINFDSPVMAGDYEYFWLAGHDASGALDLNDTYGGNQLKLCVTNVGASLVETVVFYEDAGQYTVSRQVVNFGTASLGGVAPTGHDNCLGYGLGVVVATGLPTPTSRRVLLAVSPLTTSTNMKIMSMFGEVFPSQGNQITAVGEAGNLTNIDGSPVRSRVAIQDRYKLLPFLLNPLTGAVGVLSQ